MASYENLKERIILGNPAILNLGEIIRYNNRAKIKHENVAEHTFYVSSTVLKICKMFDLNDQIKLKALEFATVHDIPEMLTGDMPYDTKVNNPELAQLLYQIEIKELEEHLPEFLDSYKDFLAEEKAETVAYLVVKLADAVSVLQYSNLEISLGNMTKDMEYINTDAGERVSDLLSKLKTKVDLMNKVKDLGGYNYD